MLQPHRALILVALAAPVWGHEGLKTIEVVDNHVEDRPLSRIDKPSVVKKEVVDRDRIAHKAAMNLARAVDMEPGVQTTLTCANCGSQRITLNGLRGENTTVMIDGIPAFSTVSSFYGMEAMPMVGIDQLEISRGAGAALTAPEAIGGVVNVVTLKPDHNSFSYTTRAGENQLFQQQLLGTYGDYHRGTLVAAQTNQLDSFDEDNNGVAESAKTYARSVFVKHHNRLTDRATLNLRAGFQDLELIGGDAQGLRKREVTMEAGLGSFTGDDVRRRFGGDRASIADWIRLKRQDAGGQLSYHATSDVTIKGSFALSSQEQRANYMHGYDYDSIDNFRFYDLRSQIAVGENHLLTMGLDHRNEEMNSFSRTLFRQNGFARDSFEYSTLGAYVQDEWFVTPRDELNLVVRIDHMAVRWPDPAQTRDRLDQTAVAPRLHYKHMHSDTYTSRLSVGVGYRMPLSLFESQHGTNDEGFANRIDRLERAETLTYTLNRETAKVSTAISLSATALHDMAYGDERRSPLTFTNARETYHLGTLNFLHVWRVERHWTLEFGLDYFHMPEGYTQKLPVAQQETRGRIVSDYHWGKNELVGFLNVVGPRNLRRYNYERNFNVLEEDIFFQQTGREQKKLNAPLFATIDLQYQREVSRSLRLQLGALNVLDTTQKSLGETPLAWQQHGEHFHLDNRHLWGPTQGRSVYAGLSWDLL